MQAGSSLDTMKMWARSRMRDRPYIRGCEAYFRNSAMQGRVALAGPLVAVQASRGTRTAADGRDFCPASPVWSESGAWLLRQAGHTRMMLATG